MKNKKLLLIIAAFVFAVGIGAGIYIYNSIFKANTTEEGFVYIATGSSFEEVAK